MMGSRFHRLLLVAGRLLIGIAVAVWKPMSPPAVAEEGLARGAGAVAAERGAGRLAPFQAPAVPMGEGERLGPYVVRGDVTLGALLAGGWRIVGVELGDDRHRLMLHGGDRGAGGLMICSAQIPASVRFRCITLEERAP